MKPYLHALDELDRFKGDPNFMLSLARGIQVIVAFSERKLPLTIAELSRMTGLDRAVVKRCLYTLCHIGLVEARGKKFLLGSEILSLGHAYFSSSGLIERSQVHLDQLGEEIFTNCALAILNNRDVVYLTRYQSKRLIEKHIGMGSRLPAYCTSVGRVLLANLSDEALHEYLDSEVLKKYTEFTVTDRTQLIGILETVRASGYCVVNQEYEAGLTAIAIPVNILDIKTPLALSVTANAKYVQADKLKDMYLEKMLATSRKIGLLNRLAKPMSEPDPLV